MIYITGDMHGSEERLYDREWFKLKKGDVLIVCGDFGYIWNGGKKQQEYIDYLSSRKFTVAFIDGTHDNLDYISSCRTTYWKGGMIHRVKDNLIHLMRGQIYNIDGVSFFTFGGGESMDKDMRIENGLWWKEEMPTPTELTEAARTLDDVGCKVDYIITHEPPSLVKSAMLLRSGAQGSVNKLNGFFEEIDGASDFKHWYFGSMHEDRLVTPKHTCVFKKIIPLVRNDEKD
ncbi:MAG: metallophosphoesterase [Clostridiales bacterium]|nr:metallophosphoesterase [Candidatus Equinaster intestinalis]